MSEFSQGYITAALWSSTDENGTPLDAINASLSDETRGKMEADCADFTHDNAALLEQAYASDVFVEGERYNESCAGHDFWLTRCGHGAGFWDRSLGNIGEKLSKAARGCGNVDLYIGDDGTIHGD